MKLVKRISLFFLLPVSMFCLGFYANMKLQEFFYPNREGRNVAYTQEREKEALPAASEDKPVITADTAYIVEEADVRKGTSSQTEWIIPEQYVGMDREKFVDSMREYESSPSLKDRELGLVGVEVLSFSDDRVVVRKNYAYKEVCTSFYLVNEAHYVTVYCDDLKTVYMNTNIKLEALPDKLQQEIIQRKYIDSEEELYNFLESYSS